MIFFLFVYNNSEKLKSRNKKNILYFVFNDFFFEENVKTIQRWILKKETNYFLDHFIYIDNSMYIILELNTQFSTCSQSISQKI